MRTLPGYAAVILAGGGGRRLGGPAKPALPVAGTPMLHRVLAAVADASPRIVVGPVPVELPADVRSTTEQPSGGGPAAATAAGLALLPPGIGQVALLAADLPLLTSSDLHRLRATLASDPDLDGAVYVDRDNRPQWLCGVWRLAALSRRRAALPADLTGWPLRRLLSPLRAGRVTAVTDPPPWWDCDTEQQLRVAEQWAAQRSTEVDDGHVG